MEAATEFEKEAIERMKQKYGENGTGYFIKEPEQEILDETVCLVGYDQSRGTG